VGPRQRKCSRTLPAHLFLVYDPTAHEWPAEFPGSKREDYIPVEGLGANCTPLSRHEYQ